VINEVDAVVAHPPYAKTKGQLLFIFGWVFFCGFRQLTLSLKIELPVFAFRFARSLPKLVRATDDFYAEWFCDQSSPEKPARYAAGTERALEWELRGGEAPDNK
jgi:hypothetical protein